MRAFERQQDWSSRQIYRIFTSLGGPYDCSYSNIHVLYNDKPGIRFRSLEKVVEEIDYLVWNYGMENIKFADELFAVKKDRVTRICNFIMQLGYDSISRLKPGWIWVNEKMLKKMKWADGILYHRGLYL